MSLTPMNQTCTWNEATGSGTYGTTFTAHTLTKCRYSQETAEVKKPNSQVVISNAMIRTASAVKANDQIVYGGVTYPVLSVKGITGIGGGIIEYEVRL
jgi:hypothetical protein